MSPTVTILMLIVAWLAVAGAMLWGVLRISRRHHYPAPRKVKPRETVSRHPGQLAHAR
jgi:hypothetical protein